MVAAAAAPAAIITPDMPEADYRAAPLPSWSAVKGLLDTCPAQWLHDQQAPRSESAAMIWGTLLHAAVLEPDRLAEMIVIAPTVERDESGKAWTHTQAAGETWRLKGEAEAAAQAVIGDRYGVTQRLLDDLMARADATSAALPAGAYEVAMQGVIEGEACKGRADCIAPTETGAMLLDLKTTGDVTPRAIQRAATDRHWLGQLWTYGVLARQSGHPVDSYGALVVQAPHLSHAGGVLDLADRYQTRPHARLIQLSPAAVEHGRAEALRAWRLHRDCSMTGVWSDWPAEPLEPPRWAQVEAPEPDVDW